MRIGIIAEGRGDCAVLNNILWTILNDDDDIQFLRPEFDLDETDLQGGEYKEMTADEFSSWTLVQKDCVERSRLQSFLVDENIIDEERAIIIQIDTAECELENYDVIRPAKDSNYCTNLRTSVINQINKWLNNQYTGQLYYAICIEEMEAWLLTLFETKDSSQYPDPKRKFHRLISKKKSSDKKFDKKTQKIAQKSDFEKMSFYAADFKKKKKLTAALKYNQSLNDFVTSLKQ
ncbi:hypothetical protein [Aureispira anguillae]|uniref:DUF4276 family protein n=1 Tax=Aureispira anguillae TaxID=2864201 RepID=A0A915YLM4_9BACT|nr:hypothetical protein [Aureispira anguillae]BDS15187.1 hypothetical protein AsAng_0059710 [Aureispira anguillae]